MADYRQIDEARKVLGLGESATIPEIKEAYRKRSLKYHPDKCKDKDKEKCEKKFKEINSANKVLIEYCLGYRFSFKEPEETESRKSEEMKEHVERFYSDWIWEDLDNE